MSIYKRGGVYWANVTRDGKRHQFSTGVGSAKAAADIEAAYITNLAKTGFGIGPTKRETRTIGELLDRLKLNYEQDGKLSAQNASLLAIAKELFGSKLAADFKPEDVESFIERRRTEGYANATINRTIEVLRRAFNLTGVHAPKMSKLSEKGNERQGFVTATEMEMVLSHLADDGLRDFVRFAWITGMRKGEVESLRWSNMQDSEIVLAACDSKNRNPRTLPIAGDLIVLVARRREARRIETRSGVMLMSEFIFHRGDGRPVGEFKKSWRTACVAAGVGKMVCSKCDAPKCKHARKYVGRIFHDLRRSAIRDLVRAGVPQKIVMEISGHRTISVFNRYNIVDDRDKREALRKSQQYREEQQKVISIGK